MKNPEDDTKMILIGNKDIPEQDFTTTSKVRNYSTIKKRIVIRNNGRVFKDTHEHTHGKKKHIEK